MTWPEVHARRLARHGLTTPVPAEAMTAQVGIMCGAHAQMLGAAELSIGMRVDRVTRTDVRRLLWTERRLVKTYGPRGTVHLLPTAELALWTSALSTMPAPVSSLAPDARLTGAQTDSVVAAIADALVDDDLTVDELSEAVVARTGPWAADPVMPAFQGAWPRWRQALTTAAHRGALCFGPDRGRRVTYTDPRRWSPGLTPVDGAVAVAEVLRRYLHAYGPATPRVFARWAAVPPGWATTLFDSLADDLEPVEVEGTAVGSVVAGDTVAVTDPAGGFRLLPHFDAYAVGCHPRDQVFPGAAAERALSRGQAGNVAVVLLDGVVAGVWHQRRRTRRVTITVEPFVGLTAPLRRQLDDQIARIGAFLEATPDLVIGAITAGRHL